ncbi:MAG: hypothetical protein JEZ07_05035 [Phycisphaerae bacterium]|nr:hypothetical protein [Phycisphaerae bacterium]
MNIDSVQNLNNTQPDKNLELRQKAAEFVNKIFYGTLMQQMRQASDNPIFGKTPGMNIFQNQMDSEIINRISQSGDAPLVDAIMKQLTNKPGNQAKMEMPEQNYYQAKLAQTYRGIDG